MTNKSQYPPTPSDGTPPGAGRLDGGSWLPLGSQENALEGRGHLFEPQASCAPCPPPLAFFCKLRGTLPEFLKARSRRGTVASPRCRRRAPATINQHTEPATDIFSRLYGQQKRPAPQAIHCQCSRPFKIRSKLHSKSTSKLKSTGQEPSLQLKRPSIQLIIHTLLRDQRLMIPALNDMPVI